MSLPNNESKNLPGFYYCPSDKTGLVELTFEDRCTLVRNQGNYAISVHEVDYSPRGVRVDMDCLLDNKRIPTHRKISARIPIYGAVPFDLK